MIGKNLNLQAESLAGIFVSRPSEEESQRIYREAIDAITDTIYPKLVGYLEGTQVLKQIAASGTLEELEAIRFNTVYPEMFEEVKDIANKDKSLSNDVERTFIFTRTLDNLLRGAHEWMSDCMRQRAQVIIRTQKKITLPGLTAKKGGLIIAP